MASVTPPIGWKVISQKRKIEHVSKHAFSGSLINLVTLECLKCGHQECLSSELISSKLRIDHANASGDACHLSSKDMEILNLMSKVGNLKSKVVLLNEKNASLRHGRARCVWGTVQ